MVNSVLDGICTALHTAFPDYKIYTNMKEQGFAEPCFYVKCLTPNVNRYRDRLIDVNLTFVIQFFANTKELINEVSPSIFIALEVITADTDLMRASGFSMNSQDDILTVTVDYKYHALQPKNEADMRTLEVNEEIEG